MFEVYSAVSFVIGSNVLSSLDSNTRSGCLLDVYTFLTIACRGGRVLVVYVVVRVGVLGKHPRATSIEIDSRVTSECQSSYDSGKVVRRHLAFDYVLLKHQNHAHLSLEHIRCAYIHVWVVVVGDCVSGSCWADPCDCWGFGRFPSCSISAALLMTTSPKERIC